EFIMTALILGIVIYMIQQVGPGGRSIGTYASYGVALLVLGTPVRKLQEAYVRIQEVMVAAGRTFSILDSKDQVPLARNPRSFPRDWKKIEYRNVSLDLGGKLVLDSVHLQIYRGEVVAFVGESGSGKSSLVNLLERFFDPTKGEILVDGVRLQEFELLDLRSQIALVSQDVFLFSDSIERNIWAGDFSKDPKLIMPAAQKAFAHEFIMRKQLGYQTKVGDRGNLLSGGEKQRLSIARAFLKDAPILILDEATSALDSVSEIEVQKGLESLMQGRSVFVIAHRLSSIQKAHRIFVLKNGKVVESGSHSELVESRGEYSKLYFSSSSI
ncbi:MAG: ATP-binding cassette domain-containing protein, partial [Bdellovibrio sp.]